MRAVILAAGVGGRLAPLTRDLPKCLLPVGGRPILGRMLEAVAAAGIDEAVLVVGHRQERIRAAAGTRAGRLPVRYVENPAYRQRSLLSLWCAREFLDGDVLVMDADVLFAPELLARLVTSRLPSALLLDRDFRDTGEEVKLYAQGPRVVAMGKRVEPPPPHDVVGEGVGFFKCAAAHVPALRGCLEEVLAEEGGQAEYEPALDRLLRRVEVGWVDVGGLPWTEIDFVEDLERAERVILPRIEAQARLTRR